MYKINAVTLGKPSVQARLESLPTPDAGKIAATTIGAGASCMFPAGKKRAVPVPSQPAFYQPTSHPRPRTSGGPRMFAIGTGSRFQPAMNSRYFGLLGLFSGIAAPSARR